MLGTLLALAPIGTWGFTDFLIAIVVIAACVGITYAALQYFGITIPSVVVYIFWIVLVAIVAILAIRVVASL